MRWVYSGTSSEAGLRTKREREGERARDISCKATYLMPAQAPIKCIVRKFR